MRIISFIKKLAFYTIFSTTLFCHACAQPQDKQTHWLEIAQKITEDKMNSSSEYVSRQLQKGNKPNRLIEEKSPYLLQHAFNPVD
ncbi:MAG: hypothetical protein ACE5I1_20490, partial [bacterium]